MIVRSRTLLVLLGASTPLGCAANKEQVMLSARLESPELTVTGNSLVTDVMGSFGLVMALGARASDPTTVQLGTFSLQRGGSVLLDPLELATEPAFPIDIGVGRSKEVQATIDHPDGEPELAAELCGAELQIVGTLTDSLGDDRPLSVTSEAFSPDCP